MVFLNKKSIALVFVSILSIMGAVNISAQELFLSAPENITAGEEFEVKFTFKDYGLKSDETIQWVPDKSMTIVSGPSKSSSTSITIQNGKTTKSEEIIFTYIVKATESGTFNEGEVSLVKEKNISIGNTGTEISSIGARDNNRPTSQVKESASEISSIGARDNSTEQLKYSKKSKIVTAIKGWCYNADTYKWVGKNNFIHYDNALEKPNLYAKVCHGLQMCKYSNGGTNLYILKWLGQSGIDRVPCYIILDEQQYAQMRDIDSKGLLLLVKYLRPVKPLQSDNLEIRKAFETDWNTFFGARLEGDVIRFNHDDSSEFKEKDGILDFEVKSGSFAVHGYFEVSKSEWAILFSL